MCWFVDHLAVLAHRIGVGFRGDCMLKAPQSKFVTPIYYLPSYKLN